MTSVLANSRKQLYQSSGSIKCLIINIYEHNCGPVYLFFSFVPLDPHFATLSYPINSFRLLRNRVVGCCVISGFHRGVNEIFALLGCYLVHIHNDRRFGTTYQLHFQGSSSLL
jgi:hypothetical protein